MMRPRGLLPIALLVGTILRGQSPQAEAPYKIGGDVSAPRIASKVEPEYTREARKVRREGDVIIELVVTRDGEASEVRAISNPLGFGLDESAIKAVEKWCFKPGEKDGKPVPIISQITVRFRLPR
ncbi:MAG TPA: energy transducer TonB [Bryobacteraceae bacterium]|nr:energy transducer TonB [Bryobacteraceae bacterium]